MYGFIPCAVGIFQTLQRLLIGVGGQFSGFSIANDETRVIRTDTYGAYLWNASSLSPVGNAGGSGAWQQMINANSMPPSWVTNMMGIAQGVFEVEIAPSSTYPFSVLYLVYPVDASNVGIFVSTDSTNNGASWVQTGFTPITSANAQPNDIYRRLNQKMAVHPTNPDVVFVGFQGTSGLWATANGTSGASSTWAQPSGFPAATAGPWITGIVFNPNNPNQAYAYSQGNGIYVSNNAQLGGSSTWSKVTASGTPTFVGSASFALDGSKYYVCTGAQDLGGGAILSYNGTSWTTEVSGTQASGVACDPHTAAHIIAIDGFGALNEHTSGGWSGWTSDVAVTFTSPADIPWSALVINFGGGANAVTFSRTVAGKIYANCANDFFNSMAANSAITTATTVNWTSQGVGQEQLVSNVMCCPPGGTPIFGGWDHAIFAPNLSSYPTTIIPDNNQELSACWSLDNAKFTNTNFVVAICDGKIPAYRSSTACKSCYSANGGAGPWTKFFLTHDGVHPSIPSNADNGSTGFAAGNIAVSTPTNFVWAPTGGTTPQFTTDGGINWASITVAGAPSFAAFYSENITVPSERLVVASVEAAGVFYLWYPGHGIYKSTNGGANFSLVNASPSFNDVTQFTLMKEAPGNAGNLWFSSPGPTFPAAQYHFGSFPNNFGGMYYSLNGGATVTQVQNVGVINSFDLGAVVPGQSYPAAYFVGFVQYRCADSHSIASSGTMTFTPGAGLASTYKTGAPIGAGFITGSSYVAGTIQAYDNVSGVLTMAINSSSAASGSGPFTDWCLAAFGIWQTTGGPSATPIWNQLGPFTTTNAFDIAKYLCADPSVPGQIYIGYAGSGAAMRK